MTAPATAPDTGPDAAPGTVEPIAITAASVVSAAGLGLSSLGELLACRRAAGGEPVGEDAADYPPRPVRMVPDLRVTELLGRKGTRNLDRLTTMGLVTATLMLHETGPVPEADRATTGVALGTATGSVQTQAEIGLDTLVQDKPYLVNPSQFPNTVMNSCAGQIAIRNTLRGVNATLAAGQLSSLHAVRYARIAMGQGRVKRVLTGGVEDLSVQVAWAWHRTGLLPSDVALGEGCALLMLDDPAAPAACDAPAELLACEVAFVAGRRSWSAGLRTCVDRALARSGVAPGEVDVLALGAPGHPGLRRAEERALLGALGRLPEDRFRVADALGECYSASGAMQVAALVARWAWEPSDAAHTALVTSIGPDGNVGCVVVRKTERHTGQPVRDAFS